MEHQLKYVLVISKYLYSVDIGPNNGRLKQVNRFRYLGVLINKDGNLYYKIRCHIEQTWTVFMKMRKVLIAHDICLLPSESLNPKMLESCRCSCMGWKYGHWRSGHLIAWKPFSFDGAERYSRVLWREENYSAQLEEGKQYFYYMICGLKYILLHNIMMEMVEGNEELVERASQHWRTIPHSNR